MIIVKCSRESLFAVKTASHARTMHGTGANDKPKPRRATVINVFGDGVISNSNEPLLEGVPVIPQGDKMDGQFFPLLFDPDSRRRDKILRKT